MGAPTARDLPDTRRGWSRFVPWLLVAVALLSNPRAGLPGLSYYFRDFTLAFYPLHVFSTREFAHGRWPGWNPHLHEGTFALPQVYPLDLLQVLWPGPAALSWLLTLHLPLAALAMFALARRLGASRAGAFVSGAAYALGGLALSCLNLYVFLQALALAPVLALTLREVVRRGGRWIPLCAAVLAASLTTLAVEFVVQAVVLGLLLGWTDRGSWRTAARTALALLLGVGLAAVPIAVVSGLTPETVRGCCSSPAVSLENSLPPVALLQAVNAGLFGPLSPPGEKAWGRALFAPGDPYFLSLYLGPLLLAFAVVGFAAMDRRKRLLLLGVTAVALWYALGRTGHLAPVLTSLPFVESFRYPVKAVFLPYLAVCLAAGAGLGSLLGGKRWPLLGRASAAVAFLSLAPAAAVLFFPDAVSSWAQIGPELLPAVRDLVARGSAEAAALAALGVLASLAVARGWLPGRRAGLLLAGVLVLDLARSGAGMNPQVSPRFFEAPPELSALELDKLGGGRVFTYEVRHSLSLQRFFAQEPPQRVLWSFLVYRRLLGSYTGILDGAEMALDPDLTGFAPRPDELSREDYLPESTARLVERLRQSAVSRVLSLDPLFHPDLSLRARVPAGPPGLFVHVYELLRTFPREYVACAVAAAEPGEMPRVGYRAAPVDGQGCGGSVVALDRRPAESRFVVEAARPAHLVVRNSYARGWRATVDGCPQPVVRINGRHQGVAVPAGRHVVTLRYVPPGLRAGVLLFLASLLASLVLFTRPTLESPVDSAPR
ncbi:MAG TPA: YfhO family protein [Vicinamibacteria bacterium]|nr:YfhO family protein [Vicinamibacteria bacterium]